MRPRSLAATAAMLCLTGLAACDASDPAYQYLESQANGTPIAPGTPPVLEGTFSLNITDVNGDPSFVFPAAGRTVDLYTVILDVTNPNNGSLVQIREISDGRTGRIVFRAVPGYGGDLNGSYAINTATNTVHLDLTWGDRHLVGDVALNNILKINHTAYINSTLTVVDADPCAADRVPPTVNLAVGPARLWPANHQMIRVASGISAADNAGGASLTVTVSSSESANGTGDGNTSGDWSVVENGDGTFDVFVRAERSGNGNGRTYSIVATATDACSNSSSATGTVLVPKKP